VLKHKGKKDAQNIGTEKKRKHVLNYEGIGSKVGVGRGYGFVMKACKIKYVEGAEVAASA